MKSPFSSRVVLGAVLVVVALGCGLFMYRAGGFPSLLFASKPTAAQMVDEFEASAGRHPGFRRNHAKGLCVSGYFESNGNAAEVSRASFFKPGVAPVIGRLSTAGGDPAASDARGKIRSLALSMKSAEGETWGTSMNSIPVFPVNTPEGLFEQLRAFLPDKNTGRADPEKVNAFHNAHPEGQVFQAWLDNHPPSSGFDNAAYYSVSAFHFVDAQGQVRAVRWSMVPETPYTRMTQAQMNGHDPDFLSYGFATRLAQGPVRWHLVITLAEAGDPTADATRLWPENQRRRIDAGVLVIDKGQSQIDGACRDIDFNPLNLPSGIEPSDDPLLLARPAAYAESHKRRTHEEQGVR